MERITHQLTQGEPSWHAFRFEHFGASEASAMLGLSPYKTRDELLAEKKTGLTKEVNAITQEIFANGHKVEKEALPIVEKMVGTDLYPVTMSFGKLSASCDGLDLENVIAWENKQYNKAHFEQVKNGELPEIHWPQCQQVLYVTGAEKLFFTITDGTEANTVGVWVYPSKEQQEKLISGWAQFSVDLKNYVPPTIIEKVEAETIQALPVPSVVVRGEITASNLSEITPKFDLYLGSIKTVLSTDQDFVDAEANAKNCRETEKRIEALRANIIAQMVDVNAVDSALANYQEAFRKSALQLEKAVKEQKESIKTNAILKAQNEYLEFMNSLIKEVPVSLTLRLTRPNFAEAIKGVKTIETMHSRLNDAVAKGKTEATILFNTVKSNIEIINSLSAGVEHIVNVQLEQLAFANEDYINLYIANVRRDEEARIAQIEANAKAKAEAQAQAKAQAQAEAQKLATQAVEEAKHQQNVVDIETKLPEALKEDFTHIFEAKINTKETDKDIIVRIVSGTYGISEEMALDLLVQTFGDVRKAA